MIKGVSQNFSPEGTPKGYAFFSKNVIINRKLDEIVNEKGTKVIDAFATNGISKICGLIPFGHKIIVFYTAFTHGTTEKLIGGDMSSALPWTQQKSNPSYYDWTFADGVASSQATGTNYTAILKQNIDLVANTNIVVSGDFIRGHSFSQLIGVFLDAAGNTISRHAILTATQTGALNGNFSKTLQVPIGATAFGFIFERLFLTTPTSITLDNLSVIGATLNQSTGDRIGVYDELTDTFVEKVNRTDLDFSEYYPIRGKAKLNSKEEIIVAFTDSRTFPKYINLDTADPSDSLDLYNLSFLSRNPNISTSVVEGAGGVPAGAYFVTIQYIDKNKASGNFSPFSSPVYIVAHSVTDDYRDTQGSAGGVPTSKAIKIDLTDLDPKFTKLKIAIVARVNDNVTSALYKEISYSGTTASTLITGGEITTPLTIEQTVTLNQYFEKVDEIEALNDQLFLAGLTLSSVTDFQKLANKIIPRWTSMVHRDVLERGTSLPHSFMPIYPEDGNKKGFMHDEVYALYAQFELPNGRLTDWFHIPGRELSSGDRATSTIANAIRLNGNIPKKYQLEDTCTLEGVVGAIENGGWAYGRLGVWENENETYGESFPDFAGQKVRHHRFPSNHFLKSVVYNPATYSNGYLTEDWDLLGLRISFESIPEEFIGKFTGVRIGFAKRNVADMTVLGYDIVMHGATHTNVEDPESTVYASSGNFVHRDVVNENLSFLYLRPNENYIRIHSPDIFILRPTVETIYLSNQLRYRLNNLNNKPTDIINYGRVINNENGPPDPDIFTYVSNFIHAQEQFTILASDRYKALSNSRYIPPNVILNDSGIVINNKCAEEFLHAKLEGSVGITSSDSASIRVAEESIDSPNLYEETVLTAIKALKSNLFLAYTDQTVVPCSQIIRSFDQPVDIFNQGDVFITLYSFVTTVPTPNDAIYTEAVSSTRGIRNIKAYLAESRFNLNQRYNTIGDYSTYFYPFSGKVAIPTNPLDYWTAKIDQLNPVLNVIQYSKDFNTLNEYEQYGVYVHGQDYIDLLPFAISRSQKSSRASDVEDGWRVFSPNDIFYTVRDKGKIKNLVAWGTDSLLIHHERALFKTRDKAVLQTDVTLVSLGSGEIFSLEPAELAPNENGYGGLQHRFGALLCEGGYIWVDAATGEIFLYKGGESIIPISKGFRTLFESVFRDNNIPDNPFKEGGITLGFDKENYRLLLSLKGEISFTASFDLIKEEWVGLHDCLPDILINTRKQLYSFKDTAFYAHNKGPVGTYYGIVYPSFVDIIVNDEPTKEKILGAITWFSKVTKNGAIRDDETITHVTIWNDTFCTGKLEVNLKKYFADETNSNTKRANGGWNFNSIKDAVIDPKQPIVGGIFNDYRPVESNIDVDMAWFDKNEMRGLYFIIRLEYSNFEDKSVSLRDLLVNMRLSAE